MCVGHEQLARRGEGGRKGVRVVVVQVRDGKGGEGGGTKAQSRAKILHYQVNESETPG